MKDIWPSSFENIRLKLAEKANKYDKVKFAYKVQEFYFSVNDRIGFGLLIIWAIVEIVICSFVLNNHAKFYPSNFMNGLCEQSSCDEFMVKALWFHIIASVLLLLGNIPGYGLLMAPWFFNVATGIFPLIPIVLSSYKDYRDLSMQLAGYKLVYCYWFNCRNNY